MEKRMAMTDRKIKITISPLGEATFDAIGFSGQGCKEATKVLEDALASGDGEMEVIEKPEWSETESDHVVHETHTKNW
jgi:hypothetical protein